MSRPDQLLLFLGEITCKRRDAVTGRGMAAALCLGAAGVCVGTRLVASVESNAHDEYKRQITEATEEDIARTCIFGPESRMLRRR
jgi:NAD(P)H-dependent flavin oxidoreductase YrpB (nitropropane dioxygenase family)